MPESDKKKKRSKWFGEGSAVVIAAVIGLVSAVLTAILPVVLPYLSARDEQSSLPNITRGVWQIVNSVDDSGTDWDHSTLKFTSQVQTPTGAQLEGFFEWRNGNDIIGREYVIANLEEASRQLFIEGQYTEAVARHIATGSYSASLTPDGQKLESGTWGNTPGRLAGVPGRWEARR